MYKKIDEQTKQKIIEMTKQEKSNAEIMLECHVGKTIIKQTRAEAGLKYDGSKSTFTDVTGGDTSENEISTKSSTLKNISNEDFEKLVELVINEINAREELSAKIEELSASTAHIGHASIDVLDGKQSKDYIIHIMKCGDDPERDEVCDYDEALNILMEYNPKIDEDYIRKMLSTYDQKTERKLGGRTTIMPNHGQQFKTLDNDVKDWKEAFDKLNARITDLESKL